MPAERPGAVIAAERGTPHLVAANAAAHHAGARPGQTLTEARAFCPALSVVEADPEGAAAALAGLALWAGRYTPLVAADPPDGLMLDIAGCDHLFGGEAALAADLAGRLGRAGLPPRLAIAGTRAAAWALAHAGGEAPTIIANGAEAAALAPLPVPLLRLDAALLAPLHDLGLRRIGDLMPHDRPALARRFPPALLLRLDQALGRRDEPAAWAREAPSWQERLDFAEPVAAAEPLQRAVADLADRLCRRLEADGRAASRFVAGFVHADGAIDRLPVALARPGHDAPHLVRLLGEQLTRLDPRFGIDTILLAAGGVVHDRPEQPRLDDPTTTPAHVAMALDDMASRLGPGRIWRVAPATTHLPDRPLPRRSPLAAPAPDPQPPLPRPVRLFTPPQPLAVTAAEDGTPTEFLWRGSARPIRRAAGPERIAEEWWRADDGTRDYYRVEDAAGRRYWLFRRDAAWFLHGLFA